MMKTYFVWIWLLTSNIVFTSKSWGQQSRCATDSAYTVYLESHPEAAERQRSTEQRIQKRLALYAPKAQEVIYIPVVVHVLWNQPEENISDAQIQSQIEVLNEDFNALNSALHNLPDEFRAVLANVAIEFCLASLDPRGRSTNGITRTFTNTPNIAANRSLIKYESRGGVDAWDTERYLNLWVGKRNDGILGESTQPGVEVAEEQGIIVDFRAFGNIETATNNAPYNLGRTTTHEVGHFLGIGHLWGSGGTNENCTADDGLADTPLQANSYFNECPSDDRFSCGSMDMYMNFMNFTDDACLVMFTEHQKQRMRAVLAEIRPNLRQESCPPLVTVEAINEIAWSIEVHPNPVQDILYLEPTSSQVQNIQVSLYNRLGQRLKQLVILSDQIAEISMTSLPQGVYTLVFQSNYKITTKLILKK